MDNNEKNCLFYYSSTYNYELLIDKGININQVDCNGRNCLFYQPSEYKYDLLINNGINIHQVDRYG